MRRMSLSVLCAGALVIVVLQSARGAAHGAVALLAFTAVNFCYLGSYYAFNLSAPAVLQAATGLSTQNVGFLVAAGG